ncbi:hypothetical protein KDW36_22735 [Burkholderia dolosa]|uniref:hypothetical protein n=1 Tax=Burkholderia dolosa TaxID=152500 RepID=UPI001B963C01|nr:hypothetical protein [Burkholderia dolosa]MBR8316001.1 hypothetical protein [Burkholderia dolosa]
MNDKGDPDGRNRNTQPNDRNARFHYGRVTGAQIATRRCSVNRSRMQLPVAENLLPMIRKLETNQ